MMGFRLDLNPFPDVEIVIGAVILISALGFWLGLFYIAFIEIKKPTA